MNKELALQALADVVEAQALDAANLLDPWDDDSRYNQAMWSKCFAAFVARESGYTVSFGLAYKAEDTHTEEVADVAARLLGLEPVETVDFWGVPMYDNYRQPLFHSDNTVDDIRQMISEAA